MPTFELDHVAIAVRSIKDALRLFKDTLGGEYLMGGEIEPIWRWVQLSYPNGRKLELLEPLGEGFLSNFLDKHGEGLHHITFKTDDIHAAIGKIQGDGYELVDINTENEHWKEAFLRPSKSHGTLIQIAQSSQPDEVVRHHLRPSNYDELFG
jgi:methylmalonyl-CoA/ethylmalonyl-CoA epimerase